MLALEIISGTICSVTGRINAVKFRKRIRHSLTLSHFHFNIKRRSVELYRPMYIVNCRKFQDDLFYLKLANASIGTQTGGVGAVHFAS